jgi:hypothetical protein
VPHITVKPSLNELVPETDHHSVNVAAMQSKNVSPSLSNLNPSVNKFSSSNDMATKAQQRSLIQIMLSCNSLEFEHKPMELVQKTSVQLGENYPP